MKHSIERCRVCENYLRGLEQCKFCSFEWALDYPPTSDYGFDLLDLDGEIEWEHLQLMDRLYYKKIECLFADIFPDELAFIIGCNSSSEKIADALNVDKRSVYCDYEHSLIIVNLIQEKLIRLGKDIDEMWDDGNL